MCLLGSHRVQASSVSPTFIFLVLVSIEPTKRLVTFSGGSFGPKKNGALGRSLARESERAANSRSILNPIRASFLHENLRKEASENRAVSLFFLLRKERWTWKGWRRKVKPSLWWLLGNIFDKCLQLLRFSGWTWNEWTRKVKP